MEVYNTTLISKLNFEKSSGRGLQRRIKMFRKHFIAFALLFCFMTPDILQAQESADDTVFVRKAEIALLTRVDKDSVVLRWAPSTPGGWVIANQIGYVVEKVKLDPEKPFEPTDYERLNQSPLKPLPLEEWKAKASQDNMFSAIAAQAIYGKLFIPKALDENNLNALKNAADELMNRYSFALFAADNDAVTAEAMGLGFVDRNVKNGESYVYRVYVSEETADYSFDTAYVVVDVSAFQKSPAPYNLTFESGDGFITLKWKENELIKYSGYYVYRSEDGNNFIKLTDMPMIAATPPGAESEADPNFRDTLTINYKNYYYRIFGVTPFGELSEAAEIMGYSKDLTAPPAPILDKPKQFTADEVSLSWKIDEVSDDLKGFVVARSNNSLYNFEILTTELLPKNIFQYTDKIKGLEEVYYAVASVDTAGNMSFSLPQMVILIDTIPPSIPKGLTGKIDSTGVVTLSWNLGTEWNLLGYRVLRANDPAHEFEQLTGLVHQDTVFADTVNINTLTRYVYYQIASVNTRYQHSEMSPDLALKRPDIIPPVEAVFKDVFVTDSSVYFEWIPSTSEDVSYQIIQKKKQVDQNWKIIDSLSNTISNYLDLDVEKTITYEYTIVSVDSSGLQSPLAFPINGRPYDTGKRKPVDNFTAIYNPKDNAVVLKWNYLPANNEKHWYVIYRGVGDAYLAEYKAVDGSNNSFVDNNINSAALYKYGIVVMTSNGGESKMATTSVTVTK